jgi:hypothetical protein
MYGAYRWKASALLLARLPPPLESALHLTDIAYSGIFGSSDQIPQRLVEQSVLSPDGAFDPSNSGTTHRYALTADYPISRVSLVRGQKIEKFPDRQDSNPSLLEL